MTALMTCFALLEFDNPYLIVILEDQIPHKINNSLVVVLWSGYELTDNTRLNFFEKHCEQLRDALVGYKPTSSECL
jgi:hypothetical protein